MAGNEVGVTVIDEQLVFESLSADVAESQKGDKTIEQRPPQPEEDIIFNEVEVLRLSYKNVLRIDNLVGFSSLHTLCLDNNIIEEIVNLDHMVNLRWLDLSFNNITEIKGLENLTKLQDLSLFNNRISKIENIDALTELECFSIGNNSISRLDDLLYLRQFKKLRLVNLEGNQVCNDPEYRMYVLAYLDGLRYLDYALVEDQELISAREQYQDELLETQEREQLEEANQRTHEHQMEVAAKHKKANLDKVESLFTHMFEEDNELPKLKLLPGFDNIVDSYTHEFRAQAENMVKEGLEMFERAEKEHAQFLAACDAVTQANERKSIKLIEEFNRRKKKLFIKLQQPDAVDSAGELEVELEALEKELKEMCDKLFTIEMQQVDHLFALLDTFESRAQEIRNARSERVQVFFRAVEDLENSWYNAVDELAQGLVEKLNSDILGEEVTDEVSTLLSDRDSLIVAVQGSHDTHLGKLLNQEDAVRDDMLKSFDVVIKGAQTSHSELNRSRIAEIQLLLKQNTQEIQDILHDEQADDEYGD